jgi:hypothetical protein
MTRLALALLTASAALAQSITVPSRHFRDGEILRVEGAIVTIRDPRSGPCLESATRTLNNSDAVCIDPGHGFFQVHLRADDVDYIEITVGRVTFVPGVTTSILLFETFTSQVQRDIDTAVGAIDNLDKIRTIRIRLLKVKTEKMFR